MPPIVSSTFAAIILYVFFINVQQNNFKPKEAAIFVPLIALFTLIPNHFISSFYIANILANTSFVVTMALIINFRIQILSLSLVYAIFTNIIFLWSGILSSVVFDFIRVLMPSVGELQRYEVTNSLWWSVAYIGIAFIIGFFISYISGKYLHKKIAHLENQLQRRLGANLLFSAIVALSLFFINIFLSEILVEIGIYVLVYAIVLTVCFISLVFAIIAFADGLRKDTELKHKIELLQDLESYTNHVETMATEMRKFRHDHKNLMLGFHKHIECKDWDNIKNYYSTYMGEFLISNTAIETCMDKLSNIQSPELKTILFLKFLQIQSRGIKIAIEVENILTVTDNYNLLDLYRIIGILTDNAMEACQGVENSIVRLMGTMIDDNAYFVLQNTCHNPPPINVINKKGFTTKEGYQGLGLYNVSQLIRRNKNLTLQTKIENKQFTQELTIMPEV